MPVRSIPKNSRSLTGKVLDFRSHRAVSFASGLERDFYVLLDFDPTVAHFEEQPVTIAYQAPLGVLFAQKGPLKFLFPTFVEGDYR